MQEEYYYKTKFSSEKFDYNFIKELEMIKPTKGLKNCPPNLFVPKNHPEALKCFEKLEMPGHPQKLMSQRG